MVAIDAIDSNSIPTLQKNQNVEIDYDSNNARIARLRGAPRDFPDQAKHQVLTIYGVFPVLFVLLMFVLRFVGRLTVKR